MRLPADELERRLTEFQVVEAAEGQIIGALGVQIIRPHALLHSEGYTDFSLADAARQLFWERVQTIAAHYGVFRVWTVERAPFWTGTGFQPANAETLARLPAEWSQPVREWLTLQLKNEEAITATLEKELAAFKEAEKLQNAQTLNQARAIKAAITTTGLVIGVLCFFVVLFLLLHHPPFSRGR